MSLSLEDSTPWRHPWTVAAAGLVLLLAGCNNDTGGTSLPGDGHDHDAAAGRLVFTEANGTNSRVYIYDLEEESLVADFALTYPASAVYASPGGRYAAILQRNDDQVQFVDSGLWLHDDHVHEDDPALLDLVLTGVRPTHYRANGDQATIFFDGDADAAVMAEFSLFTDASLGSGGVVAGQTLATAHHGIAEPLGGLVLASRSPLSGESPDGLTVYELHGDHFHDEGDLATECPGLHGGASNDGFSAFGCEDGVLVAELHGDHFHEAKIPVDERIAILLGHHDLPQFAAFSYPGYNLYVVDPEAATAVEVDWRDGAVDGDGEPVTPVHYGLDAHGEHLAILDEAGTLHVLETADWHRHGDVAVLESVPSGGAAPRLAFGAAEGAVFVTDPAAQAIRLVDLESLEVHDEHVALDFAPAGLAWTGVAGQEHDHDHDDDDGHDH